MSWVNRVKDKKQNVGSKRFRHQTLRHDHTFRRRSNNHKEELSSSSDIERDSTHKGDKNNPEDPSIRTADNPEDSSGADEKASESEFEEEKILKKADKILACPRCKSTDTKFCYYNNYNVNQPRHFCRNCRRYWTSGGSIRNVPFGAGRRKNVPFPL